MSILSRLKTIFANKRPAVAAPPTASAHLGELPPFNLNVAEAMRFDSQVRIGLGARNGLLMGAEVEAVGGPEHVSRWVGRQWERLWAESAHQLLRAKLYGFAPLEVRYRMARGGSHANAIEPAGLRDHHPRDCRLLVSDGEIVGFSLPREGSRRRRNVIAPLGLVCTFDAEFGNPYGCALLERAYPAWWEKWMNGGAKKTLRLRMVKDAFIGDVIWYPADRKVELPSGETVSWRDVAREMIEARTSGGAMTLPLVYDNQGRKLVDYSPPRDVAGATHIFQWKHDVDLEIWKALEVPPEIIEAASVGSGFSGRMIPFIVALSAVQQELTEIVRCVDRDVFRPLVRWNFGVEPEYELRPRALVDSFMERMTNA